MAPHKTATPKDTPAMMSVTDGAETAGFIKSAGPKGWQSFDRNGRPIGLYKTQAREAMSTPAPVDVLRERAESRAFLWATGEIASIPEAVDALQAFAIASGLVKEIGVDAVQAILSAAFTPYRRGER